MDLKLFINSFSLFFIPKLKFLIIIFCISGYEISCNYFEKRNIPKVKPIARAFDTYLYHSDIHSLIIKNMKTSDSIKRINDYIKQWTLDQVLLHQAMINLVPEQLNLDKQLEDYKNSLIIYSYEKEIVREKLDTLVPESEVENYYNENKKDFQLKNDIAKIVYVKVSKKTPYTDKLREWIVSTNIKDKDKLDKYCYQYAQNFFLDDNVWLMFDDVLKEIPIQTYNQDIFLQSNMNHLVQIEDTASMYFLEIRGYMIRNSPSPLSFEKDNIRKILLNKHKLELIEQVKNKLYEDAQIHNDIEAYK